MHVAEGSIIVFFVCDFIFALSLLLFCHCCPCIMHGIVRANPGRLRQSQREPDNDRDLREGR